MMGKASSSGPDMVALALYLSGEDAVGVLLRPSLASSLAILSSATLLVLLAGEESYAFLDWLDIFRLCFIASRASRTCTARSDSRTSWRPRFGTGVFWVGSMGTPPVGAPRCLDI